MMLPVLTPCRLRFVDGRAAAVPDGAALLPFVLLRLGGLAQILLLLTFCAAELRHPGLLFAEVFLKLGLGALQVDDLGLQGGDRPGPVDPAAD